MVRNPPAMQKTWVQSLGWEDSLGGGHGNPLQYSCLETEEPGYSTWGHKESDMTEQLGTYTHKYRRERFPVGIGSRNRGGREVPSSAVCRMKTEETQW